jgi:signal transduction histidine kinase
VASLARRFRVTITVKVLVILAIPVLGCLIVAATEVEEARAEAAQTRYQARLVRTAAGPTSLTTSLIDERTIGSLERSGLDEDLRLSVASSVEAREATDQQVEALQGLVASRDEARGFYQPALDALLGTLGDIRADADSGAPAADVDARYTRLVTQFMRANAAAVDAIDDPGFRQGAQLGELATRQKETRAKLIDALIPAGVESRPLTGDELTAISGLRANYQRTHTLIRSTATADYEPAAEILFDALDVADLATFAQEALSNGQVDVARLYQLASYDSGFVYALPSGDFIHEDFRQNVVQLLGAKADERSAAAAERFRFYALVSSIGLIGAVVITGLVVRSITRPMRSLNRQAIELADHRLPDAVRDILERPLGEDVLVLPFVHPIQVKARDEVTDVAAALDAMRQSALDLAVDQAVLMRNTADSMASLGRRNQELLRRQIEFLTELEQDETDADTLAYLFHLDHLATRMRRNAEALLLLARIDIPGQQVNAAPLRDLIRAAVGETEEYQRVQIQGVEPVTVLGHATMALAHLLAELIDNALTWSPSTQPVTIQGASEPGGGYLVTVRDFGADLGPEEITQANRRFAGAESYTVAPSKYLAYYIAGSLALQHDIAVSLHRATGERTGTVVTIKLPADILQPADSTPTPPAVSPGAVSQPPPEKRRSDPGTPTPAGAASQSSAPETGTFVIPISHPQPPDQATRWGPPGPR